MANLQTALSGLLRTFPQLNMPVHLSVASASALSLSPAASRLLRQLPIRMPWSSVTLPPPLPDFNSVSHGTALLLSSARSSPASSSSLVQTRVILQTFNSSTSPSRALASWSLFSSLSPSSPKFLKRRSQAQPSNHMQPPMPTEQPSQAPSGSNTISSSPSLPNSAMSALK